MSLADPRLHCSLRAIDAQEAAKRANEDARNTLESYLYRVRDLLDNDNTDTPFRKCSKATERNAISARLSETMAWMHDNGDGADTKTLLSKRNDLEYAPDTPSLPKADSLTGRSSSQSFIVTRRSRSSHRP
jgi:hypothetical protein